MATKKRVRLENLYILAKQILDENQFPYKSIYLSAQIDDRNGVSSFEYVFMFAKDDPCDFIGRQHVFGKTSEGLLANLRVRIMELKAKDINMLEIVEDLIVAEE